MSDELELYSDLQVEAELEQSKTTYRKKLLALRHALSDVAWWMGCPDPGHDALPGEPCRFVDLGPTWPQDERITGVVCPTRLWAAEDALK